MEEEKSFKRQVLEAITKGAISGCVTGVTKKLIMAIAPDIFEDLPMRKKVMAKLGVYALSTAVGYAASEKIMEKDIVPAFDLVSDISSGVKAFKNGKKQTEKVEAEMSATDGKED